LLRHILAAGLKPWLKLWQNLRASRTTELAHRSPSFGCSAWLDQTERIADEFYRMVTDDHFKKAIQSPAVPQLTDQMRVAQNPTQDRAKCEKTEGKPPEAEDAKPLILLMIPHHSALLKMQNWAIQDSNEPPILQ
jgi:hypothetical protein